MKYSRVVLILAFAIISQLIHAQDLGFISTTVLNTNVDLGDTIFINTKLKNYDNSPYTDTIGFKLMVNGSIVSDPLVFKNPLAGQQLNIGSGDSLAVSFIVVTNNPVFLSGPNGLVIWPISDGGTDAHDSLFLQINLQPTAIAEIEGTKVNVLYAQNQFVVKSTSSVPQKAQVIITDLTGAVISNIYGEFPFNIPAPGLPKGIYLVNVMLPQQSSGVFKVVVQ